MNVRRGGGRRGPARTDPRRTGCDQVLSLTAVRGRDACPCARLRLWTLTWRPAQEDAPDVSRDTGRSAGTPRERRRRRTAARRATAVMVVSSALLAVSPLGSIVAVAEDPADDLGPGADDPGLRLDLLGPQLQRHRARIERRRARELRRHHDHRTVVQHDGPAGSVRGHGRPDHDDDARRLDHVLERAAPRGLRHPPGGQPVRRHPRLHGAGPPRRRAARGHDDRGGRGRR